MCADFVISLSPVSQRRTNSWVLTRCFHRGFFFFFTVKYQSICTGKNHSVLPYFLFLTHAEWRGSVQFGRVEQEELHHLLVYPGPSSLTGLQSAEVRSSEVRHYYMPSKGYPGCAFTVQDSTYVYRCYVFSHGFCITTIFERNKVKHFICFYLAFTKFSVFGNLLSNILFWCRIIQW